MSQQRRTYTRQQNYQPYIKPYYVKKKPQIILVELLSIIFICIVLLTGTSTHKELLLLSDVYPDIHELPPLVEEEAPESDIWIKNLVPPIDNAIYMAWDYDPLLLDKIPPGVNVLAPTWFYLEEDAITGKAVAKNLLQMGKTNWNPQQYVELCHANGVKVWGTFVCLGRADLVNQAVTNDEIKQEIISQLVEWTYAYKLDGISLDFEYMRNENIDDFTEFAKDIKEALPANQNIVSVAVTEKLLGDTSSNKYQSYDRGGLANVIDYVAVMTYGGHKYGTQSPVAGIDYVETHILRLLEEMPSNKLIMGIPFYGVDFISRVIDSDSFDIDPLWKENPRDYRKNILPTSLNNALANNEFKYTKKGNTITISYWLNKGSWSEDMGVAQYSFVDSDSMLHNVYIDDESSLYQKGALVIRYNLAGVGIWREGYGYDAMWEALADSLNPN